MKTNKSTKVTLRRSMSMGASSAPYFAIEKITNAITVPVGTDSFGVGDTLTTAQAEQLCADRKIDVTVTQ